MKELNYARFLGELFVPLLKSKYENKPLPECIIPMPLHQTRLQERGFNQATEIAKPIAKALNVPINHKIVYRQKETLRQSQLSKKKRRRNMQSAFLVNQTMTQKHVAVLDDVITTGETILSLCKALKNAGIKTIDVWCLAKRTLAYRVQE